MTYNAIVEARGTSGFAATVLGWPDCTAKGATKAEALAQLRRAIVERLKGIEIVPLEVELPEAGHPLARLVGMFREDPLYDQFLEDMADYRREIDAETAD